MTEAITTSKIPEGERMDFMSRHFGMRSVRVEMYLYGKLDQICEKYKGGYWDFYELSNGGYMMCLDDDTPVDVKVDSNYYSGTMTMRSASITACLYALNNEAQTGADAAIRAYYDLYEYARQLDEWNEIYSAIN